MRVFLFSGHMIDSPTRRDPPRFPPALEGAVQAAIDERLDHHRAGPGDLGVGSAACGSDLLIAEALLQRGAALQLYLPFDADEFLAKSVAFAGDGWVQRFHAVTARAEVAVFPVDSPIAQQTADPYARTNLWMLQEARRLADGDLVFLHVWNGQRGDGPGGTAHMVSAVEATAGGSPDRIDLARL